MNASFRTRLFAASVVGLALALCGGCATPSSPNQPAVTIVEMHFHSFEPKSVTIHAGESVEWRNTTPFVYHTVTDDPAKAETPADVALPPGVQPFDSGHVASGASYQRVFMVPGTYRYFCEPHESKGMVGEVIVLAGNQAPSQAPVEPSPPAVAPSTKAPVEPVTPPAAVPATAPVEPAPVQVDRSATPSATQAAAEPATQPASARPTQPATP